MPHKNKKDKKAYYKKHNATPQRKAYMKAWAKSHLEECRAKSRKYYHAHRAVCIERNRAYKDTVAGITSVFKSNNKVNASRRGNR